MSTYRELVQDIITQLDATRDKVGALRDAADTKEKEIFNATRGLLFNLISEWNKFDNSLSDNRADMQLPWQLPDWK